MNLQRAISFVERHGSALEQARLAYSLTGKPSSNEVVSRLFVDQRDDGGFAPFWAADYSSLDATCFHLARAEQLGVSNRDPGVVRALAFLAGRQRDDGHLEEDEAPAAVAPPWAKPGDTAATLYLTANCGLWLAVFRESRRLALKAADYLVTFLEDDGRLPSFLHTHWLTASLWYCLSATEPAERVLGHLQLQVDRMASSHLAWLLTSLKLAGLPDQHPLVTAALAQLEAQQRADGSWPSEDGPDWDVHVTLEALRAFKGMKREL